MYLTFSNLNSIHWLINPKKDIGLNVLFRTFSGHFMTIFRSNYFHLKNVFFLEIDQSEKRIVCVGHVC